MPPKNLKPQTRKVKDITALDDTSPASSPRRAKGAGEAAPAPLTAPLTPHNSIEERLTILETCLAEQDLKIAAINVMLQGGTADATKAAVKRPKTETVFNWFKTRLQSDDALYQAIMGGNNADIWEHGEYKSKFLEISTCPLGKDTQEIKKKISHTLWTKCFKVEERSTIKEYRDKVDPPPEQPKRGAKKDSITMGLESGQPITPTENTAPSPAPKKAGGKKASTKAAAKPAPKGTAKSKKVMPPPEPETDKGSDVDEEDADGSQHDSNSQSD